MMIYRNAAPLVGTDHEGYVEFNAGGESIRCGNRTVHGKDIAVYHADIAAVKACFLGDGVCGWFIDAGRHPEDGETMLLECGYALHYTDRGWTCDGGHEHVTAEVRWAEHWDYCSSDEAEGMARVGVEPRDMQGRVILL